MKFRNLIFVLPALAFLASCQMDELTQKAAFPNAGESRTVKLTVLDDVKSSYSPGTGVNIDGTENIAVLYSVLDTIKGSLKAVPSGSSIYSFTIPEEVVPDEMYYGVMPYSQAVAPINTEKKLFKARIFPVQYPTSSSFDPHYDFLSAEGFSVTGSQATISRFKRLVAPLRVRILGLPSGSRIRTAEMILSQGVSEQTCTGLVGDAFVYATDNYRKSAIMSLANPGNSVSAVYPEGLEAEGNEWNVWYIVNPTSLYAESKLTLRISADTTTFTREVTLPSNAEIERNELSQICVDMSASDVREQRSVTFDFSQESVYETLQSNTSVTLTGSDGKNYTLAFNRTKCALKGEDGMPCAIQLTSPEGTAKYMTIPSFKDKNVVSVHLFAQLKSACTTATEDSLVVIRNGNTIASVNANMGQSLNSTDYLGMKGGVAELNIPEIGSTTLSGGQIQGRGSTLDFSAMTLILENKETPVYDKNDYLSMFEAGLDIEIAGKTFNIEDYPNYTSCRMSDIADLTPITGSFDAKGLVFIDNDAAEKAITANGNIALGKNAVIIGRYISGKGQPRIAVTKTSSYFQVQNSVHLLNIQVEHNSSYCFFTSKSGYSSIHAQDCTFLSTDSYGHGFIRYNASGVGFTDILVDNSIFIYGGGSNGTLYMINNASGGNTADNFAQLRTFSITNSVFIPLSGTASAVKTSIFNAPQKTDNATFTLESNSFYGMTATDKKAILNLKSAAGVTVKDNVFYSEAVLSANRTHQLVAGFTGATVTGNWMNRYESGGFTLIWNPAQDNFNTSAGPFFDTTGLSNHYMPVNTEVVTNSAGATYDTKKWKQWMQ